MKKKVEKSNSGYKELYAVKDRIALQFTSISFGYNSNDASRSFALGLEKVVNREDYALYFIGWFDPVSGVIKPTTPQFITDWDLIESHRSETNESGE